jgi:hypothetical protein
MSQSQTQIQSTQSQAPSPKPTQVEKAQAKPQSNVNNLSLEEKLRLLLQQMRDWERKKLIDTGVITVELVKLPKRESKKRIAPERLALHLKLSNSFKGIIIDDIETIDHIIKALTNSKVKAIAEALQRLNGATTAIELEL